MTRRKLRLIAYSLAVFTVIAGITAYLTTADQTTNVFKAAKLQVRVAEPHWKDGPTIVPEQIVDKDPYIVNTDETPAFVFMKVTVPVQKVTVEYATGDDEKGLYLTREPVPLFRFIDSEGRYTLGQTSAEQAFNTGWHFMEMTQNTDDSGAVTSLTYLYAWTNKAEPSKELAVLAPGAWTDTPLFDQVIFCNAREDEALSGSIQSIYIEVFGIQTEHLLGSDVTTNDADTVWSYFSE